MKKKVKKIPSFRTEEQERKFWETHDGTDYFDFSKASLMSAEEFHQQVTPITIRFSKKQLDFVKVIAQRMDVGYQSLIKVWLDERLLQEKNLRGF